MQKEGIAMFSTLPIPIIQAPMAGGVSTPELAAAVSNAGGSWFFGRRVQDSGGHEEGNSQAADVDGPAVWGECVCAGG